MSEPKLLGPVVKDGLDINNTYPRLVSLGENHLLQYSFVDEPAPEDTAEVSVEAFVDWLVDEQPGLLAKSLNKSLEIPAGLADRFYAGETLSDEELILLLQAYVHARDACARLGPVFYLAHKEAGHCFSVLRDMASARAIR